jgi:hypothetical protein
MSPLLDFSAPPQQYGLRSPPQNTRVVLPRLPRERQRSSRVDVPFFLSVASLHRVRLRSSRVAVASRRPLGAAAAIHFFSAMIPLFVLPFLLFVVLASSNSSDLQSLRCADHHPIRIWDERERLLTATPVIKKSWGPSWGSNYPESGLEKPPRRDTRAVSKAGMFGGKAPLRLVAQESRPHAPLAPMRSAPAYFLSKCCVYTRLD